MTAALLDLLTTIFELCGLAAFVVGVAVVFGAGVALMVAGLLLVGLGWLLAPDPGVGG